MSLEIDGRLVILTGSLATLLLGMDRSTGEGILGALLRQDLDGTAHRDFDRRVRVNESDGAGYNDRAEKGWVDSREETWDALKFTCEVHFASGTHAKVYAVVPLDVSGMIQTTLSLRDLG